MTCRRCHCSEDYPCLVGFGWCWWAEPGLCSRCAAETSLRGRFDVWLEHPHSALRLSLGLVLVVLAILFIARVLS
jgi:hypothetical protein